jgi:hypothetical protein
MSSDSLAVVDVRTELRALEPIFHRPELGRDYERMTAPDFWEVGASGRRYGRAEVLDTLARRPEAACDWPVGDFACRPLGASVYLVTYTLAQGERVTRRATLWERAAGGWRAIYHQGTLV